MSTTAELITLLQDPDLHRIDFTLGGQFAVRGGEMPVVAAALRRPGAHGWTVVVNPGLSEPYCDSRTRQIGLRHPHISTIAETYGALHEAAHAMLFVTGRDRGGMAVMGEIGAILLPIAYLFIHHPAAARSGALFAQSAAARDFVDVVQRNHLHMACAIVPMSDVQALWRHAYHAMTHHRH